MGKSVSKSIPNQPHFLTQTTPIGRHQRFYTGYGMSYQHLIAEHDDIDRRLNKLLALVLAKVPDVDGAVIALSDLASALGSHLAHEDRLLYTRMIDAAPADFRYTVIAFNRDFDALRADWEVYLHEWSSESINYDWYNFAAATKLMAVRLAARVRAENEILYSTALKAGVLTMRDPRSAAMSAGVQARSYSRNEETHPAASSLSMPGVSTCGRISGSLAPGL